MARFITPDVNFMPSSLKDKLSNSSQSTVRFGARRLRKVAQDCGYAGIELHGIRSPHLLQLALGTKAGRQLADSVFSIHQSWCGAGEPVPHPDSPYPLRTSEESEHIKDSIFSSWMTRAIMLESKDSLRFMQHRLSLLGRPATKIIQVVYADMAGNCQVDRQTAAQYPNAAFHLTPDVLASWNVDTPEGLVEESSIRGLRAEVDSVHTTRKGKSVDAYLDQRDYLPALLDAGRVSNLRLSFFRKDFNKVDPERVALSNQEGLALIRGTEFPDAEQTHGRGLATTFGILREHNWRGNVTVSAPFGGMAQALGFGEHMSYDQMAESHQQLIAGIQQHMSWIPPDSWQPMPVGYAA